MIKSFTTMHYQTPTGESSVPVRLSYDPTDPHAVVIRFYTDVDGRVCVQDWRVSREVLREGSEKPAGMGDFRVFPAEENNRRVLRMVLAGPEGTCIIVADALAVQGFLNHTFIEVPAGTETYEAAVDQLLRVCGVA